MSSIDPSVLRRIKKCLALANDGRGNEAEAANALRQAQALMRQHNVDVRTLARAELSEESAETGGWVRPAQWEYSLATFVSKAFGCGLMALAGCSVTKRTTRVLFIGPGGAAELVAYAYTVVRRSALKARVAYLKPYEGYSRGEKIRMGESFCYGYVTNVSKQVQALSVAPELEQEITALIQERTRGHKAKSSKRATDHSAYCAGAEAGRNLSLNRPMGTAEAALQLGHN
jgi:hypothetical protein